MIISIWIALIALVGLVATVGYRVVEIRLGKVAIGNQPTLHSIIQPKIDLIAYFFVSVCRDFFKFLSIHFLTFIHRILSFLKVQTFKTEKKFSKVVDAVKGRGPDGQRGSASFFLAEIQKHTELLKVQSQSVGGRSKRKS